MLFVHQQAALAARGIPLDAQSFITARWDDTLAAIALGVLMVISGFKIIQR